MKNKQKSETKSNLFLTGMCEMVEQIRTATEWGEKHNLLNGVVVNGQGEKPVSMVLGLGLLL